MKQNRLRWVVLAVATLVSLAGCGGGGGSAGTSPFGNGSGSETGTNGTGSGGSSNSAVLAATATLVDASGNAVSSVATAGSRVKITAKVGDTVQAGALVTIKVTTGDTKVTLNPADGSAVTDSNGVAYVQIAPKSLSATGAFALDVSVSAQGATAATTLNGSITAGTVSLGTLTSGVLAGERLAAFGTTEISVPVQGASSSSTVTVTFASNCVSAGKASLSPATATVDADGRAKTTYKDLGCATTATATDTLSASVDGAGGASGSLSLPLSLPQATNIQFIEANPSTIYLTGSGGVTSSKVSFKVVNQSGIGIPGIKVDLRPDTNAGGLTLNSQTAFPVQVTSDANGVVEATVLSGTVPTPVRITATYNDAAHGSTLNSVSSALSINSGLPTQRFMSTSLSTFNIEGMDYDGTSTDVTVRLADRSGNPVPDGTTVNFRTESGQIVGSCQSARANGISLCSGHLESQNPRPANGLVSVVSYALGEESFTDANGNNVYDGGESFEDLGDVFLDADESGSWGAGEDFVLFGTQASGACGAPTSASILSKAATCDGVWGKAHVRRNVQYVLSSTSQPPRVNDLTANPTMPTPATGSAVPQVSVPCDSVLTRSYLLRDSNTLRNNPWPAGSTVEATGTNVTAKVYQTRVSNTMDPTVHTVEFSSRACENGALKGSAMVLFKVTSPKNVVWSVAIPVE